MSIVVDQRQRLQGLAQPHVIGQNSAEAVLEQERQPSEALDLVGAQVRVQSGRDVDLGDGVDLAQARHEIRPGGVLRGLVGEFLEILVQRGLIAADLRVLRGEAIERGRLGEEFAQGVEGVVVEGEVRTVVEQQVRLFGRERCEQLGERDLVAVDRHIDAQVEPVGVVSGLGAHRD